MGDKFEGLLLSGTHKGCAGVREGQVAQMIRPEGRSVERLRARTKRAVIGLWGLELPASSASLGETPPACAICAHLVQHRSCRSSAT